DNSSSLPITASHLSCRVVVATAMSLVDSTAVFEARAASIGVPDDVVAAMALKGWVSHGTYAFAVATQPGADEQAFLDGVIIPLLGGADHIAAPKLRRLFFESHTLTSAELRRQVDATEQEAPRKLPAPEISQRMELLQARIRPLIVANFMEPSHHLINSLVQCVEDGRVRYIEWSRCTSRTQEVNNIKEDGDLKIWKTDSTGTIKATTKEPSIVASLNTELDVHNALRHRGVAYEIAQAMTFEVHEAIINYFFFELKKDPMEGFGQVTLQQVAAADRELHVRLAEATRGGFKTGPAGELPLDIHVKRILDGPELKWMLMPLPKRAAGKPTTDGPSKPSNDAESKRNKAEPNKTKQDSLKLKRLKRTPMPKKLVGCVPCNDEGMQPAPLRSEQFPMGLPNLRGVAKLKVQAANRLYSFARRVIDLCVAMDIPVICENPRRSLMWNTDYFSDLPSVCRFQHVHSCMYGGKRKKRTSFLLNFHAQNLLLECDDKHQHLPWGLVQDNALSEIKFSTSLETEYPSGLCKQLASAFVDRLLQQGKDIAQTPLQMEQAQRMGSGLQPRGGRAPLLLGDFKFKIDVTSEDVDIPSQISESVHPPFQGIPIHSKLISSRLVSEVGDEGEKRTRAISTFGVFRSPFEFLHRAMTLEHPLDTPHNVDKSNLKAILFIRDHSASEVVQFRAKQLKKYMSRAAQLSEQEFQFKETLDVDVRRVLEGKRLLLFKEMAADAKVGDETLFQELTEGFRLTGEMPQSKQFPAKLKPAMISVQQLRESSVWAKEMIHSSCRRVGSDPEIAKAVFEETQQQLKGRKQLICQAELFPVIIAKNTWKDALKGRSILWFIDNNSSLAAIIRSYSPVLDNFEMLVINARLDTELQNLKVKASKDAHHVTISRAGEMGWQ
ncbi:unnamed protein product, partial [Cladocopium goreaui]